jgi:hypothetical protein
MLVGALLPHCVTAAGSAAPLFAAADELELTLTLPLRTLLRQRSARPNLKAMLELTNAASDALRLDVKVRTRGKDRLARCAFPPLRIDFDRGEARGTPFAGQKRLKLVTLCKETATYERYLEIERFVYRAYAALTDESFLVRRAHMRYVDIEGRAQAREAPAFFIEPIAGVAERVGARISKTPRLTLDSLDPSASTRVAVFQFAIGNTDWAATAAAEGEDCCHNTDVLVPREGETGFVLVPYDFDQAGIVDADYAEPNPQLKIRSVRNRLYRGFCRFNAYVDAAVAELNAARPTIETLLSELTAQARAEAGDYLARSYEILNDPEQRQRQILESCREG